MAACRSQGRTLCNTLWIDAGQRMTQRQYLYCAEGVQQVRIMPLRPPEASIGVLTGQDPIDNALCVHHVLLAQEMHGCEAPVDPRHAEVLCGIELECVHPLHMWTGFNLSHQIYSQRGSILERTCPYS